MRPIFQVASGFAATIAVFGAGALLATAILAVEAKEEARAPLDMDTTGLWTADPVRVAAAPQDKSEPAKVQAPTPVAAKTVETGPTAVQPNDEMTTAAIPDPLAEQAQPQEDPAMIAAHVDWCYDRYRSYDPADNLYRSYSGELRDCQSPYSEAALAEPQAVSEPVVEDGATYVEAGLMAGDHVQACMSRYRSYDPGDNTYQPYGGGPRMQCQP